MFSVDVPRLRPDSRIMRAVLLSLILLSTAWVTPALAQDPGDLDALTKREADARAREAELSKKEKRVLAELGELKTKLQGETQQLLAYERQSLSLGEEIALANERIAQTEASLADNREQLIDLLAALQRLELSPNVAKTADPDDAVKTAQAAGLITSLQSELQERADRIRLQSEMLAQARDEAARRAEELDANRREVDRRRERLRKQLGQKEALHKQVSVDFDAAKSESARLAAESQTLRELLEAIAESAAKAKPRLKPGQDGGRRPIPLPEGTVRFAKAKGGLLRPVAGRLLKAYGRGEKGQTYAAPASGQVVSPYAGRVDFSGPFRHHGHVVIIDLDDDYYLLMTGLDQAYVKTDEIVKRGEPIGEMPGGSTTTELYLELRKGKTTIDPSPWLSDAIKTG